MQSTIDFFALADHELDSGPVLTAEASLIRGQLIVTDRERRRVVPPCGVRLDFVTPGTPAPETSFTIPVSEASL
jgi:hypothetical protein